MKLAVIVALVAILIAALFGIPTIEPPVERRVEVPPPGERQIRDAITAAIGSGAAVANEMLASLEVVLEIVRFHYSQFLEWREDLLRPIGVWSRRAVACLALSLVGYSWYWYAFRSRTAIRARAELDLLDRDFPDAFMERDEAEGVVFGGLWVNKVAHQVKVEMGLDFDDTPLNRKNAVRIAKRLMVEWSNASHRTAHMRRDMRRIMLLVFTPDATELEYRRLERSWPIWWRRLCVRHPFLSSLFD